MATYTKIGRIRPDYADAWDSSRSYTALEMVKSADGYHAYIAKKDVPAGTLLTDTEYWGPVLDVSGLITGAEAATDRANAAAANADAARRSIEDALRGKAPAIVCAGEGEAISLTDSSDDPLQNLRIFGRTTQNGTPAPDVPVPLVSVGDKGSIGVTVCGKNLFDKTKATLYTRVSSSDGTTSQGFSEISMSDYINVRGISTFCVSGDAVQNQTEHSMAFYDENKVFIGGEAIHSSHGILTNKSYNVPSNAWYVRFNFAHSAIDSIQFEAGSTATTYEVFKEENIIVSTPNGLSGIPVSSGGNYTDADGQQWVCDEVDFERGVYVKRVNGVSLGADASFAFSMDDGLYYALPAGMTAKDYILVLCDQFTADYISFANGEVGAFTHIWVRATALNYGFSDLTALKDHIDATNPTVMYTLTNPVETPLTAEELLAYRALRSNKPTTNVSNDAGAHLEVSYNADTKTYIDNKFAELAAALLNKA